MNKNMNELRNSIAFNPMSDDLTHRGYAALACCIFGDIVNGVVINPEDTVGKEERIKRAYNLYDKGIKVENNTKENVEPEEIKIREITNRTFKYMNVRLIDVKTEKVAETFNNVGEASKFLGLSENSINIYIARGYIRDKKYRIIADINPNFAKGFGSCDSCKKVKVTNIKTGFVKSCESVKEVIEITGLSGPTIYVRMKDGKISKKEWKFENIED